MLHPPILSLESRTSFRVLQRSPSTPAIPTCDELGYKGFDIATVLGLQGPAGLTPETVERLQNEVAKVMREPSMAKRMEELGMVMHEQGTAKYVAFVRQDMKRYADAVRKLSLGATR